MSKSKKTPEQEEETKGKATAAPEEDPKPAEETPKDGKPEEKPAEGTSCFCIVSILGFSQNRVLCSIPRLTQLVYHSFSPAELYPPGIRKLFFRFRSSGKLPHPLQTANGFPVHIAVG